MLGNIKEMLNMYYPRKYQRLTRIILSCPLEIAFCPNSDEYKKVCKPRVYMFVLVTQSCLTLCDPMDCSPPRSSVRGVLQARILEWVAISFCKGSSRLRDWTWISCTADRCLSSDQQGWRNHMKHHFLVSFNNFTSYSKWWNVFSTS